MSSRRRNEPRRSSPRTATIPPAHSEQELVAPWPDEDSDEDPSYIPSSSSDDDDTTTVTESDDDDDGGGDGEEGGL